MNILLINHKQLKTQIKQFEQSNIDIAILYKKDINIIQPDSSNYTFVDGLFFYDKMNKSLYKEGKKIKLTPRNTRLLESILEYKSQQFISYEQLQYNIWDDDVEIKTIQVAVSELHSSLGIKILKNYHGIGYYINL
jgi:DNA-binding response OmpR family regulator